MYLWRLKFKKKRPKPVPDPGLPVMYYELSDDDNLNITNYERTVLLVTAVGRLNLSALAFLGISSDWIWVT